MIKAVSLLSFLFLFGVGASNLAQPSKENAFLEALALVEQENYLQASQRLEVLLQTPAGQTSPEQSPPLVRGTIEGQWELRHVLAYCYEKLGNWAEAANHYQQAASPSYDLADYVMHRLAKLYQEREDYSNAARWYQRLLEAFPQSFLIAEAKFERAVIYLKQGEYTKALEGFSELVADPQSGYRRRALYESARTYEGLQDWQKALWTYQGLIEANATDKVAADALDAIHKLAELRPELEISRSQRMTHGLVLYEHGKQEAAREIFDKVAEGYKDTLAARAIYYTGLSWFRQRKYEQALQAYDRIISDFPPGDYLTRALYQTTLCYRRLEKPELAQEKLKAFVETYNWSQLADNALYDLGWVQENQKQYDEAIASYRRLTQMYRLSDLSPQAYWRIGWIQFKTKRYTESIETLSQLMNLFPNDSYAKAGRFWIAKSYERLNQWEAAEKIYTGIVEANDWYYSHRAWERLETVAAQTQNRSLATTQTAPRVKSASEHSIWEGIGSGKTPRIEKLMRLKFFGDAVVELEGTIRLNQSNLRNGYYNLIICYQKLKKFQEAHRYSEELSRVLRQKNDSIPLELYQLLYPTYFINLIEKHAKPYGLDPLFIASMIREESRYNPEIVSAAGAFGLMQIMPATGRELAQRLNLPQFRQEMLFQPEINIQMGVLYTKDLLAQFENNYALVAGAYNGGPARVQRWLRERNIGGQELSDLDEFIEDIPITETRRHIKKVLDSYAIYQALYAKS